LPVALTDRNQKTAEIAPHSRRTATDDALD
jgi:hypothetical protein